jgi:two-component system response regulator (stage 0 sporulation protein F)
MNDELKHILIVDDDVSLGEVLQQALSYTPYHYDVRLARDADEALAHISRREFDLIITDIKMAGFSGLQLLEALRHVAPDTRTIVMTAFGSDEMEERARTLGAFGYLTKPFTIHEFRNLINRALESEGPPTTKKLPPAQVKSLNQALAELRANTGVHAAFFIEADTANVLGVASDVKDLDLTSLAKALIDITDRMTAEVAKVFGGSSGFRSSQYVGEAINLSTYRLSGEGLLIVVYGHNIKEGIISFYARQTLQTLAQILQAELSPEALNDDESQTVSPATPPPSPPQSATTGSSSESGSAQSPQSMSLEQALSKGLLNDDFLKSLEDET